MKAVVWHGPADVRVDEVDDPKIEEPTDAVIKVTSTAICGSDLHLYEILAPFMTEGDILGHEPMGIVEEVGSEVEHIKPGDRVVIPFNISCGNCWMCDQSLFAQCETTQNRDQEKGASLLGYTKLYGQVPGGQAEYLRVPQAHFGPIKVPEGPPDDRFLYLSDVLPTAWQAVEYADAQSPDGEGTVAVFGLGPIGQMAARIAKHKGQRVIAVDLVPERLALAEKHGIETLNLEDHEEISDTIREMTDGRGADSTIDAVGMEAHGAPVGEFAQKAAGLLPDKVAEIVHREGRHRPDGGALPLHRLGPPRRHGLDQRRLRRHGRPDADVPALRQGHPGADGPGAREALDRRHHAAASPTTTIRSGPPTSPRTRSRSSGAPGRLRDVPEEGGRRDQGRDRALGVDDAAVTAAGASRRSGGGGPPRGARLPVAEPASAR